MKTILVLRHIPRANGYTAGLTDRVVAGARKAGAQVTDVDLTAMTIHDCRGCFHCWTVDPGTCVFDDDAAEVNRLILEHDIVLCCSPVYYYGVTAGLKRMLERTFPLSRHGSELTPRGYVRNSPRQPERWQGKALGYLVAGALRHPGNYEAIRQHFQLLADGMSMGLCAELVRPEAYFMHFAIARPKGVKLVEQALHQAGVELATAGAVSPATSDQVQLQFSDDPEHFARHGAVYWEHAAQLAHEGVLDPVRVQESVMADMRVLMREMARCCDPDATADVEAVLQFDFPDQNLHVRLTLDHGRCAVDEADGDDCDLRVTVDADVWARVLTRQLDAREALARRRIRLDGDKALFSRLPRYFPPPTG